MLGALLSKAGTGAPILVILACLSLLSLTIIVVKIGHLWSVTADPAARAKALDALKAGRTQDAARAFGKGAGPADRVASTAADRIDQGVSATDLETELTRLGNAELAAMTRHIRTLELIAMISPLLGLLGTVLGMIQSFQELELAAGAANASVLAGGIWQALLTTAAGLIVAIPAAIGASLLAARAERGAQRIEDVIARILVIRSDPAPAT